MRDLAVSNPYDFVSAFPEGAIIDEAQKVPEIFDALKMHVDNSDFIPGKFILNGSSQFQLKQNMTDSMAGRAAFLKLLPFSVRELKDEGLLPDNPCHSAVCQITFYFLDQISTHNKALL